MVQRTAELSLSPVPAELDVEVFEAPIEEVIAEVELLVEELPLPPA